MSDGSALATVLRERSGELLGAWLARFERSELRFHRAAKAATHTAQVASLVESLTVAASGGADALQPGTDATRELERASAFLGARFASSGATGFDVAALLLELREVVAGVAAPGDAAALTHLFEWLTVVALDAFATAGLQSLREKTDEQLEAGTPVVELLPKVPALFLVGAPSAAVMEGLFARAWMTAVGTGAPCLIIDCSGLAQVAEKQFERGYRAFVTQAEGSALQILCAAAGRTMRELAARVANEHGLSFQHFDRLDSAVAHSLERAGHLLMKRG